MKEGLTPDKAVELGARALCRLAGNPENTKFEGKPMWQSYVPEARAVLAAVGVLTETCGRGGKLSQK